MIFTVLLVPPLLLCAMLALGRYEERMLDPREAEPEPLGRHLRSVLDPALEPELPPVAPAYTPARSHHGRHAA
ncbi:hypothetical protein AMK16_21955 [Streptomyces sp. CB00455]|uniref:hypothetical protein n=1 Tax=Streptomyces sp. CB00455 TaxID=1703927 RepID=UPI00093B8414|nr:hypothetical protein [Streptomyces sp. CB00455]OKK17487.1 hypothetical protein AMK16_21955 [Streptomyces sp. CB00455]